MKRKANETLRHQMKKKMESTIDGREEGEEEEEVVEVIEETKKENSDLVQQVFNCNFLYLCFSLLFHLKFIGSTFHPKAGDVT